MTATLREVQHIRLESCNEYIGVPVCAVLRDGTHVFGVLGGMQDGKVVLHRAVQGPGKLSVSAVRAKRALAARTRRGAPAKRGRQLRTKAFGFGYPFYPGPFLLDAALIALLFALPFFLF